MIQLRVYRCVGENDLKALGICSPLVALFVLNEGEILGEFLSGPYQGILLNHHQLTMVL